MLILNEKDLTTLFTMADAIDAVKEAFRLQSLGRVEAPVRQRLAGAAPGDALLFMPGSVNDQQQAGIKIVSVFPGNRSQGRPVVSATMLVLDSHTGEALCLMDGTALTQLRTGAGAGAATDLLARPDARVAALFGTGGQAARQLEALLTVRPLEEVRVFSRTPESREAFAQAMVTRFGEPFGVRIRAVSSADEAVEGADIVSAATTSHTPVFDGRRVQKGAHVNGSGSFTLDMQELDEALIGTCDRLYIDGWEACLEEAGDIMIPMAAGVFDRSRVTGELGQLLLGQVPGRTAPEQVTVFKSVGIAPQDTVTADRIYRAALARGVGQRADL